MNSSPSKESSFSCLVIGGTSLLIRCTDLLLQNGHHVRGIVSSDEAVIRWAEEQHVPVLSPDTELATSLREQSFDYLFSIVNEQILDNAIFKLATRAAINYHDAPLPKYAGTHATSWALLNGERTHGVTWHLITEQVDAGDILKQRIINIDSDETAFTLNTKCYEAAIYSFTELIHELATGKFSVTKQDLTQRTFFPRYKRLPGGGVLSWDRSAIEIARVIRALDFGPHPNPLGSAKIAVRKEFLLVPEIKILESLSSEPAGTLISIDGTSLRVATHTNDVLLNKLATIDGCPLSDVELRERYELVPGKQLQALDQETSNRIDELVANCCKREKLWVNKLGTLQPIDVPYATRTAANGTRPRYHTVQMSVPELPPAIDDRAQFLLVAWAAFLSRISNAEVFDLGVNYGTNLQQLAGFEGLFSTLLPVRVEVIDRWTLSDLYLSLRPQLTAINQRQTFMRDVAARYPNLRNSALQQRQIFPVAAQIVDGLETVPEFTTAELVLRVQRDSSSLDCVFDTASFEVKNVEKILSQFSNFLTGYASNAKCPISRLPLMSGDELRQLLIQWNATAVHFDGPMLIHALFEAQTDATPDATAIVFNQQRLSYRELNQKANQLARRLRKLGVGPEILVGICCTRSIDLIVGLLGILKAGGAYVPLDSTYPQERLAFIVEDTAVPVIISQQTLLQHLPPHTAHVLCLDSDWDNIAKESHENLSSEADGEDLAYLIYTSGSTGRPKGVAIEHHSTATLIHWAKTVFSTEELAGVLASTSVCFDLSVFEIFVPLSSGGKVIIAENALHLPTLPASNEVTLVNTVPSAMTELIRMKGLPGSVRVVNLAGEPLRTSLVKQIYEAANVQKVFDLYGPSEDTTYSTFTLRSGTEAATIGRPIANTQVYLLDRNLQPVPVGIPGELYLGGAGLARGYLHRPELTAEKFIPDPFNSDTGARLYRTGDLARYFPDGNLEYLGRLDHQVKIRGFRIELGEIETALKQHALVRDAVVIAHEDTSGARNLVAYVVPHPGQTPTTVELRDYLKEKLPQYMIPSVLMTLPAIPLTPNGKIDRRALPEPQLSSIHVDGTFVAPTNEIEEALVKMWEEILKTQPIGIRDNFFELGGHSLLAVEMFVRIEEKYGKQLPLATLFQAPTIAQLGALLQEEESAPSLSLLVPIQPEGSKPRFFCMHARGGNVLFYRDLAKRLGPDQPFYGLQAQGMDGKRPRHTRVEDMAAHYLVEIRTVQPNGPYFLGGASFGGTAAFEMAQQLSANGEEVALVALFDTTGPGYPKLLPGTKGVRLRVYNMTRRLQHQLSSLRLLTPPERVKYVKDRANRIRVRIIRSFKKLTRRVASKVPPSLRQAIFSPATTAPWALLENENAIGQAVKNYVHKPYPGHVTLFRASKQPLGIYPDPTLGWSNLVTGQLEIHEVPGYHGAIVAEPHVQFLAEQLRECLFRAQKESSSACSATSSEQQLSQHASGAIAGQAHALAQA
ncbi:MAG: non-ribosomal peptide synthetase [Acidobacteria bacterium]|nr:MAG: non-ribosomal peptide synthetase [Acidobacteriota bacterium]